MAAQAKQWSFQNIILADDASDQAVFAALVR
jgi:hypothetical protein